MKQLLLLTLLLLASCDKPGLQICGVVTDGGTRFNPAYGFTEFYLEVDGNREWVTEKTYDSFYVGDYICLE